MKAILPIRRRSLWPLLVLIFIKAEPNSYCGTRVFAWGINTAPGVPLDLTNATAVAAGAHHNLALRNDSTVMAWGDNTSGQTNVPIGLSNVAAIAAGGLAGVGGTGHSLALRSNGTVVAWGDDSHGQCQLPAGLTNVVAIAAGAFHSLALKADGRIAAWGNNITTNVPPELTNIVAVAAGAYHNLALRMDGTVVSWGGYLASGTVPPGLTNLVAISAGWQHSLALRGDGTVAAWGDNSYGQASVPAGLTNVVAVAAASYGSVALKADGTLVAWGYWALPAGLTNIVATAISAGGDQDLALLTQWPPEILVQPVSAQDYTGKEHTLRVSATSNDPLTYQWQFNGNDLAGATNSSLTLHFLHFEDAGTYTVTVSSALGSVFSQPAILTVTQGPPILTLQGTNQLFHPGTSAVLQAPIDGSQPMSYQWYFHGETIIGATNSTLLLSNADYDSAGIYAVSASNSFGAISSRPIQLLLSFHQEFNSPAGPLVWFPTTLDPTYRDDIHTVWITPQHYQNVGWSCTTTWALNTSTRMFEGTQTCMNGTEDFYYFGFGFYSGGFHGTSSQGGVGSVPAPVWLDGHWNMDLQMMPNGNQLSGQASVVLDNGNVIQFQVVGVRFPTAHKLLLISPGPPGSAQNQLTMWVSESDLALQSLHGTISSQPVDFEAPRPTILPAKATYDGLFYELSGVEQPSSGSFTLTLASKGSFSGRLSVDGRGYSLHGRFDPNGQAQIQLTRKNKPALLIRLQFDSAAQEIYGTVTDGDWMAGLSADRAFSSSGNPATNYVGVYTLIIPGHSDSGEGRLGDGYATMTIDFSGAIHASGELADGTRFSQACRISQNGQWPFYVPLYRGQGSIVSWITFSNFPVAILGGDLVWFKPANPISKLYPAGLTNQTMAAGSSFVGPIPSRGHQQLNFTNAMIILEGGNLPVPLTNILAVNSRTLGADRFTLKWDTINGSVKGSFIHPITGKATSLRGVRLQSQGLARGYFLGINESGSFILQQQPDD